MKPTASLFQSTLSVRRATGLVADNARIAIFQSTLSVRRATPDRADDGGGGLISIHALRKESDPSTQRLRSSSTGFQSTLSVRRATLVDEGMLEEVEISIHALRKESDFNRTP